MSTKYDLTTTEGVLDWAECACTPSNFDDTTAAFLAECVRLRQAFDEAFEGSEDADDIRAMSISARYLRNAIEGKTK